MEVIDYVPDYLEVTTGYMREMVSGSREAGQRMEIRMSKYWNYDIPLTASLHFRPFPKSQCGGGLRSSVVLDPTSPGV